MFRRVITTIFIATITQLSLAQGKKSIVIYSSTQRVLMPLIENGLRQLKTDQSPLFDKVTNLTEAKAFKDTDILISELVVDGGIARPLTDAQHKSLKLLAERIAQHDFLLNIYSYNLNTFQEFQFYLYERDTTLAIPSPMEIGPWTMRYSTSFVLDLGKKTFREDLLTQIYKMFPETNEQPRAVISVKEKQADKIIAAAGDTILLTTYFTKDHETPHDNLQYSWFKRYRTWQDSSIVENIITTSQTCPLIYNKEETDIVYLKVDDGVHSSIDSINITSVLRPTISMSEKTIANTRYTGIFASRYYENTVDIVADVKHNGIKVVDSVNLTLIERKPIINFNRIVDALTPRVIYDVQQLTAAVMAQAHPHTIDSASLLETPEKEQSERFPEAKKSYSHSPQTTSLWFTIPFEKSFNQKYKAKIFSNGIESNPVTLRIKNIVYLPVTATLGLHLNKFATKVGNQEPTIYAYQNISFGISTYLYVSNDQYKYNWTAFSLGASMIFDVPIKKRETHVFTPLTMELFIRHNMFRVGFNYNVIQYNGVYSDNSTTVKKEEKFRGGITFTVGAEFKPHEKWPLAVLFVKEFPKFSEISIGDKSLLYGGRDVFGLKFFFNQ